MAAVISKAGNRETLAFRFEWLALPPGDEPRTAADATRANLLVWVGGQLVWGYERGTRIRGYIWTWVELLEHLSRTWHYLLLEEQYPLSLRPASPSSFVALAKQKLAQFGGPRRAELEREVWNFTEAHELSFAGHGIKLPAIWVVPLGRTFQVESEGVLVEVARSELTDTLEAVGNAIADRLTARSSDSRAEAALLAWGQRAAAPTERLAEIYTNLSRDELEQLAKNQPWWKAWELPSGAPFEPTELLAVARSLKGLIPPKITRNVLDKVRAFPLGKHPELDRLTQIALQLVASSPYETPAEQGLSLARLVRKELTLGDGPVEPEDLLHDLDVPVKSLDFGTSQVDAVGVWGPRHGPAVLLNSKGIHAQRKAGKNATIAHELCHLLVDRAAALPLGEALQGQLGDPVEARARAFAAELLVPQTVVSSAFAQGAPRAVLKKLQKRYGASAEMIAWQARNSTEPLSAEAYTFLKEQVSRPQLF